MILGIGADLCNIDRIRGVLDRFGDRFRNRVFTQTELETARRRHDEAATLARRWAAKEACSKALGTGVAMGVSWRDMAVFNLESGLPRMELTGWAAERVAEMTPPGLHPLVHVTLTDDAPWAQAFVVIEAVPQAMAEVPAGIPPSRYAMQRIARRAARAGRIGDRAGRA